MQVDTHYLEETTIQIKLHHKRIEEVYEFRDLGLPTNHHLSWNSHVDAMTNKANRILGLLRKTCRGWKDTETLKVHIGEIESGKWITCKVATHRTKP